MLGIVGNAGGLGVIAADLAAAAGLDTPAFEARSDGVSNPFDVGAGAGAEEIRAAVHKLAGRVDALILIVAATATNDVAACVAAVEAQLVEFPNLPVLLVTPGAEVDSRFATFPSVSRAIAALATVATYAAWRRRISPLIRRARPAPLDPSPRRQPPRTSPNQTVPAGFAPMRSSSSSTPYALPVPAWQLAGDPAAAVARR